MSEYDCVGVTSEYLNSLKNRISELEAEKAELMEFIKNILEYSYVVGGGVRDCKDILKKHGVEI